MSRFTKQITSYWQQFRTVVRNEYGSIFTDAGVILVLVLALLIYSTLYSLAYGTQVLRNVPIGVIDMSNTSTSRQLINTFNAGPNVYVAYEPGDMDEAKHLFYDREITVRTHDDCNLFHKSHLQQSKATIFPERSQVI